MRKDIILISMLITPIIAFFCGCTSNDSIDSEAYKGLPDYEDTNDIAKSESTVTTSSVQMSTESTLPSTIFETTTTTELVLEFVDFSFANIPPYSNKAYVEVNNNIPFFTDTTTTEVFEIYSPLDELGRCGVAFANICPELMPTEQRGSIGMVKPSGWQTVNYNDLIDGNYLYNRCHLIAYELASENANIQNLITGTNYLNTQGMLYFENKVTDYVNSTGNHVLYRSTPVFDGNNLVASGVLMEGYSVEDAGQGVQYCVFCYNVQPGIGINYANGDSWLIDNTTLGTTTETGIEITETSSVVQRDIVEQYDYVVNKNTNKFHYPSCSSVEDIKEKNRWEFSGSRDDLIAQGYSPCNRCNP